MDKRTYSIEKIEQEFILDHSRLMFVRDVFQQEIQKTMRNEASCLKNEPYCLPKPSGNETGLAATLDFGGTNVRAHLIELKGNGVVNWLRNVSRPLRSEHGEDKYLTEQTSAEQLFDLQVQTLAMLNEGFSTEPIPFGYVFSFIVAQTGLNQAFLIRWTKEINTLGVEGRDVVKFLKEALVRNNLDKQFIPRLVMNDTIGTFMASAYSYPATEIASVVGTGYNTCYLQPEAEGESGTGKIINLECGNFDKVPTTPYDDILCQQSSSPGKQRLEKMVSGHYLGELFRLMLVDAIAKNRAGSLEGFDQLLKPYSIDTRELSTIIGDDSPDFNTIQKWSLNRFALYLNSDEYRIIQLLAIMIAKRSASLIAASYAAIINHVDPQGTKNHVIAVNGSLYEKMPGYRVWLDEKLNELIPKTLVNKVSIQFFEEGPALGAAVAVCMLEYSNSSG
jgi:hexokinase